MHSQPTVAASFAIPALLLAVADTAYASREGAAIGEGIAVLIWWTLTGTALFILLAAFIGVFKAWRRHRNPVVGFFRGALYGTGIVAMIAACLYLVFVLPSQLEAWQRHREEAVMSDWLAPLDDLRSGELRLKLKTVTATAPAYSIRKYRLLYGLQQALKRFDAVPLTPDDRSALDEFLATLELPEANKSELKGAIAWASHLLRVEQALDDCRNDAQCLVEYVQNLNIACRRHIETCARSISLEQIGRLRDTVKHAPDPSNAAAQSLDQMSKKLMTHALAAGKMTAYLQALTGLLGHSDWLEYDRLCREIADNLLRLDLPITREDKSALDAFTAAAMAASEKAGHKLRSNDLIRLQGAITWAFRRTNIDAAIADCADNAGCLLSYQNAFSDSCRADLKACRRQTDAAAIRRLADHFLSTGIHNKAELSRNLQRLATELGS